MRDKVNELRKTCSAKSDYIDNLKRYLQENGSLVNLANCFYYYFNCKKGDMSENIKKASEIPDVCTDNLECFGTKEEAIRKVCELYNSHCDEAEVLVKVTMINTFYSTGLNTTKSGKKKISLEDMANHIVQLAKTKELAENISEGNMKAVLDIANVGNGDRQLSFASKYCSWHNADFHIYDRYVRDFLRCWYENVEDKIYNSTTLTDYEKYCEALEGFKDSSKIKDNKILDVFLWTYWKAISKQLSDGPSR